MWIFDWLPWSKVKKEVVRKEQERLKEESERRCKILFDATKLIGEVDKKLGVER